MKIKNLKYVIYDIYSNNVVEDFECTSENYLKCLQIVNTINDVLISNNIRNVYYAVDKIGDIYDDNN